MSSTSVTSRAASVRMTPTNCGISSCLTRPFSSSSALPIIDCKGVFSSWDTLAENSRRLRSAAACSVTSNASSTVPAAAPSAVIWLMSNWYSRLSRTARISLCPPSRAVWMARLISWSRSITRNSCPMQALSAWKIILAAGLMLKMTPFPSSRTSPSPMFSVICSNSSVFLLNSRSCASICRCCWWIRPRRGDNSS